MAGSMLERIASGTGTIAVTPEIERLRNNYMAYVEHVHRGKWKPAKHLEHVCQHIEAVERGEIERLIICLPPRHSKSQTVTETLPSWFIGKNPDRRVIEVSYGASFAQKFGNSNRRKVSEFGSEIFGLKLDPTQNTKTNWLINGYAGGMISVGIGGSITGEGADLLIVDDVVKNRQEADSDTVREHIWDEWTGTLLTRLHPGGRIIIIMTRWHDDDLVGRVLKQAEEDGEEWTVINLPCEAEENDPLGRAVGEPLWPERFGQEWMEKKKKAVGSRDWSALYQQRPRPKNEDKMFRREWFEIVPDWPRKARSVRYWDLAATEKSAKNSDPDFTSGCRMAELDGIYYIIDVRRARASPKGVEDLVKQTADLDGIGVSVYIEQEPGSGGKNTIDHYQRQVLKGYSVYPDKKVVDKIQRALPLSAAAEAGNVKLVRGAWNKEFLDEVELFPFVKHDDQTDTASGAKAMLDSGRFGLLDYYKALAEQAKAKTH